MTKILCLAIALLAMPVWGAPTITSVSGTIAAGENITISGSSFGTSGPTMVLYDDFELGTFPYPHVAVYLLVVARTDGKDEEGITLFIVDGQSPGLRLEMIPTTAHDKQYEIHFDKARVPKTDLLGKEGEGWSIFHFILQRATILKCAEMLAGAQGALDITTDYAKKRAQFNRPIGAFQAIQHKLADLLIDVEGLRYLVYQAAWGINTGSPSPLLISMAKARANEVYERTCIEGIKTHGALGFTREQDIGLYHIRTKASEFTLGNSDFHREKIAEELDRYQPPQL